MSFNAPKADFETIEKKVRRITARPSANEISSQEIANYVNTFFLYDFPEHLRLESLRVNWQFVTNANQPVYDFDTSLFLTAMPPVFIAGYSTYMTQSRENFYRINPRINFLQKSVATVGPVDSAGPFSFQLINIPIIPGFKPNPPGAYASTPAGYEYKNTNWNVLVSGVNSAGTSVTLVDDGLGNLRDLEDIEGVDPIRGTINYTTGVGTATFKQNLAAGTAVNCQYIPYVAARPTSAVFYQDQIMLSPIPDQAYTVSFEAYKYPSVLLEESTSPQLKEWWQCLALGASLKIFEDNGDLDNYARYRPLLDEQLRLVQRRTIVQQTSERVSTIYTDQTVGTGIYPFGNIFSS